MATPFLLLILEPHDAIQLNIILSLLISLIMTYKIHNEIHKESLIRLIKGSLIGILPGLLLFLFLDVRPRSHQCSLAPLGQLAKKTYSQFPDCFHICINWTESGISRGMLFL